MVQEFPPVTTDPFAPSPAEAARQTILRRLTIGLLLVAGLAGAWVLIGTLPMDAPVMPPDKTAKAIRQTDGVIPAEQRAAAVPPVSAVKSLPSAPAEPSSMPEAANLASPVTAPPAVAAPAPASVPPPAPALAPTAKSIATPVMPAAEQHAIADAAKTPTPNAAQATTAPPPVSETKAAEAAPSAPESVKPAVPTRHKTAPKKPPTSNDTGGQFAVQMGVFKVVDNAEKLRAKMALGDIPVLFEKQATETRVLAGPFATRAQALRARDEMAQAGLGKGMLVPLKK